VTLGHGELREALERGESLAGRDLTASDPFVFDLSGCDLSESDLSSRHVPSAVSGRSWPRSWHDHQQVVLRRVRLANATLDGADLSRVVAIRGDLRRASLRGARLVEADLTEADLRNADLRGADFGGSVLDDVRLDGASWDGSTIWPEGFEPPVA
jgi:uncharacterized protein YjbI with pentapeptide repeats